MKIKKKYKVLIILLAIFLFFLWYVYEIFRVPECHELDEYKKANEIIQKIEDYRKCHGKLPESLEDIGETEDPIFYNKRKSKQYTVVFDGASLGCFFCSCYYYSETKEWINVD